MLHRPAGIFPLLPPAGRLVSRSTQQRPRSGFVLRRSGRDRAEQAVGFTVRSGGEVQRVRLRAAATAQREAPQAIDCYGLTLSRLQLIDETSVLLVDIDAAVAKVTDQDLAAEPAECERGPCHAPGRIERTAAGEAAQEVPVGVEDVDEAVPGARDVIVLLIVLLGIAHEKIDRKSTR